ncbi:MAG: hypothetical protein ACOH2J_07885 [Allorhizobium sp.]
MAINESGLEPSNSGHKPERHGRPGFNPLHEAAIRIADLGLARPRAKTKDLMALLLCHGARAWRYSQPESSIHLHVAAHRGRFPVIMRLR